MKILRLDLRAFGPFSAVSLDLSAGHEGLHLIYGPNEAGKSSALRALRNLLYGIPANSPDNFVHSYPSLRIGAVLARRDGRQLEFVRRKGTKGTLLTADEKAPLDDAELRAFLGGCDQEQFQTMFGIDHAGLIAGGRDIVRGQGEIGHVLFAAGAGISDLRTIRDNLDKQAEDLFTPRGVRPRVNHSLAELKNAQKLVRTKLLPSSDWKLHKTALDEATQRLKQVEQELDEKSRERSRLQRIAGALPAIGRWKQCNEQLSALGVVPSLSENFIAMRLDAISRLETARQAEKDAEAEIARLDAQMAEIALPDALISRSAEIEAIDKELSVHRNAQADLPGLVAQRSHIETEASALLREIRPDLALADAEKLKLSRRQQIEIQDLGNQQGALEKQLSQAHSAIADARERLGEIAGQLGELPPPCDPSSLAEAVRAARAQGNLSQQAAGLRAEIATMTAQATIELGRLGLWSGPLELIETLAVPSPETIARFERALTDARTEMARWQDKSDRARAETADIERQLEQLRLEGEVPSEADLAAAREHRDELWQQVLRAWREGNNSALLPEDGRGVRALEDLAAAYEQSLRHADELADRLRREANRVASRATFQAQLLSLQQQIAEYSLRQTQAETRLGEMEAGWRELWQHLGIFPLPPREMQAWTQRQQAIVQQVQSIRQRTAALARLDEGISAHFRRIEESLVALRDARAVAPGRDPESTTGISLDALLARAECVLEEIKSAADARRQLEKENAKVVKAVAQAEAKAAQAEVDLAQWRDKWSAAITPLGLPADASPAVVNGVVAQSLEFFAKLAAASGLSSRVDEIAHFAQRFRDSARRLLEAVDPGHPPPEGGLEQALDLLSDRLRTATADQKKRDLLQAQRTKQDAKLRQARESADAMKSHLAALCQEARCETVEELPAVESRAAEAKRLRRERDDCRDELLQLAAGATLDDFLADAASIAADALPGELQRTGAAMSDLDRERGELRENKGRLDAVLAGMDGSAAAAEAAEDAAEILAQLESDVQDYIRLRLASAVLREGIERYRKQNEGPVLARASELFRRLTLGSFDSLRIGFEDSGQQVLEGVRPDGRTVLPGGMSEGACDQLYLALRLASLENWLERNEPLPLIVDDILVSFDNARAAATLEVLAELSKRTQVIFFAHHEHLLDLARRCMPAGILCEHRL